MNFFGHSVAASWVEGSERFAFGAMLPDLTSMVGLRAPTSTDAAVARGLAFHELTDRCFHAGDTFSRLQAAARKTLAELGVGKGPRWAVAHVGLELMLDARLARHEGNVERYRRALEYGADGAECGFHARSGSAPLSDETAREALRALCRTLILRAKTLAPTDGQEVAQRLSLILGRRRSLAFDARERVLVAAWADRVFPEVEACAERWLAELRGDVLAALAH